MNFNKFSSPREEALEIAYMARNDLINGSKDAISLLRSCLVVATNLNKNEDEKWIKFELSGYPLGEKIPIYRRCSCNYEKHGISENNLKEFEIFCSIQSMITSTNKGEKLYLDVDKNITAIIDPFNLEMIMSEIKNKCLFYLNDIIKELQYGGAVEYLMEEIRNGVDEKLAELDKNILEEASSLYQNLSSTNPADWTKVAHSCRRMLLFLADKVFPPSTEEYTMKDGSKLKIGESQVINRLCAFVDQKLSGDKRTFLIADMEYFQNYLRKVVKFTHMGEHNKTLDKFDANMIAIHNYLIIGEILKLM